MSYRFVNIAMELVSAMVLIVLIISLLQKQKRTRQDRLFLFSLACHTVATLTDAMAWGFNKIPGTAYLLLTHAGNFLSYITGSLGHFFFMAYIILKVTARTKLPKELSRRLLWLTGAMSLIIFGLAIANIFNGMLYTIDENNHFRWGDWALTTNMVAFLQCSLLVIPLWRGRKSLERHEIWLLLSYWLLPAFSVLFNLWEHRLMLAYPALMLSLLLIYVNVQQEQERRLSQQELALTRSNTSIMLSQIQPHFLYNALTSIQDLCTRDPAGAEAAIRDFSRYLRGNMDSIGEQRPVLFEKEMEHVRIYLSLEKMRFEERLQVVFDIEATDFRLPSLSLQPIVENAVRYGVTRREGGGTVTIRTREATDGWRIIIEDDGAGFDPGQAKEDGRTHTGIDNVRQRLASICDGRLTISSTIGKGTVATIIIPREAVQDEHPDR